MSRHSAIAIKFSVFALAAAVWGAAPLAAQPGDFLLEGTSITLGAFNSRIDTDLRVDGETFRGTQIDLEQDLDLEENPTVGVFGISHLFGQRHQVELRFNRVSRDRERVLTREITFRDTTFEVDVPVVTTFDTDTYDLIYTNWIIRKQALAFGLSAGLQWQSFDSTVTVRNAAVPISEKADGDLPVPVIGFNYRHLLTDNSRVLLSVTLLPEVHVGDVESGSFTLLFGAYEWRLARNLALGACYTLGDLSVEFGTTGFLGDLDYITEGFQVYGRILF